ncbi:MAG TPA: phosphotransferase [Nanoarchaeota archaeon]|nr:phosphotransferase [Nanoarchaeota archaeon]
MKYKQNFFPNEWLVCDFHIHTTFSDGKLPLREVVDLYGQHGVDVIAITDHVLDKYTLKERKEKGQPINAIEEDNFKEYLKHLWKEQKRAWEKYKMLLIPGIEITNNHKLYHILGIDVKDYVDPTLTVEEIVKELKDQNALAIAAHPDKKKTDEEHLSWYLWKNQEKYRDLFDAWEVANRDDLFNSIGVKKYNYVANSDFHEKEHIYSWKTLVKCEKNIEAIKEAIIKNEDVAIYLMRKKYK